MGGEGGTEESEVPPIEKSYNEAEVYRSVVERYYTLRFKVNATRPGDDYCLLIHSNRVCVVTLADSHYLMSIPGGVTGVDFKIKEGLDRSSNNVSGKSKHGAQRLSPTSALAVAVTSDGDRRSLVSVVGGKLLEVNLGLVSEPGLLTREPRGRGYLAVVLPDLSAADCIKKGLLDSAAYSEALATST